jgi:Skp family chaperone for outer membrane proteins
MLINMINRLWQRKIGKLLGTILFIISVIFPSLSNAEEKSRGQIAVVDIEAILESSIAIQHMRKQITGISAEIQVEASSQELNLKNLEGELIKQREILSEDDFKQKVATFNKQVSETQKELRLKKLSLEQAHSESVAVVHNAIIEVIANLAKKYDFTLVLPSTQVLFVNNDLNITLEVISNLNNKLKVVKVNYKK